MQIPEVAYASWKALYDKDPLAIMDIEKAVRLREHRCVPTLAALTRPVSCSFRLPFFFSSSAAAGRT